MRNVYITSIKRTPIGKFLGGLSTLSPSQLGTLVVKDILNNSTIDSSKIDEVIVGNVLASGHGQNIARQIAINSGLAPQISAYTLNMICGSGLKAINQAYMNIAGGFSDIVLAGGVESMSKAAFVASGALRTGHKMGNITLLDTLIHDGLTDAFGNYHMGITAENIAEQFKISRLDQDDFAYNSQTKALAAQNNGHFTNEIVPVTIKQGKEEVQMLHDEYINKGTTLEKLGTLKAAFSSTGSVTAGNASGLNDGAAMALLVAEDQLKAHNLIPMAKIIGIAQIGLDPAIMGMGPLESIKKLFSQPHINKNVPFNKVDLFELNEAFSSQSLGVTRGLVKEYGVEIGELTSKVNISGGAIALGHPLGASGARVLTTLIYNLKRTNKKYGVASLCIGGGMGIAILVERV
ncbi:Acetyl-CoA C-acetyltransferase [Candidatus Hepatincolaceae symbiont of Richtersius coronifer]